MISATFELLSPANHDLLFFKVIKGDLKEDLDIIGKMDPYTVLLVGEEEFIT
jgi:hypothetical protein